MSDHYPSNAHSQPRQGPPPRVKQQAVISNVVVRHKPWPARVADRSSTIVKDVLYEVIKPLLLDLFAEGFHAATDRTFYGGQNGLAPYRPRTGKPNQFNAQAGYVVTDYASMYTSAGATQPQAYDPSVRPFDFSVYTFSDYAAGRELIDRLTHVVLSYGRATANDLYDLLGKTSDNPAGESYGWEGLDSINGIEVRRVRGGGGQYFLAIPDAKPLKK